MKTTKTIIVITFLFAMAFSVKAQNNVVIPDLSEVTDNTKWKNINREITFDGEIFIPANPGNGLVLLKGNEFSNGTIELDIKGENKQGESFVGLAFHGLNDSTYDAVYFRPFNFKNPERNSHSVQYISMPDNDWSKLRTEFPGKFENKVSPVPDPDGWFHATIVVNYPEVTVYVNKSESPSLLVSQISTSKKGWLGFWVGNNSEGRFKNLKITTDSKKD